MEFIKELIEKLEELTKEDNQQTRKEIAINCSNFLDEKFKTFNDLNPEIQNIILELDVMEETDKRKEQRILHMKIKEIKPALNKVKEIYKLTSKN